MKIPYTLRLFVRKARRYRELILRILLFPLNIFFRQEKFLWVFGNSLGYRDNSRYLFEYVVKNHPEIYSVWIANDQEEKKIIEATTGVKAMIKGTLQANKLVLKSKMAIVSMGAADIGEFVLNRTTLIHLFHGIPLKKIGLDSNPHGSLLDRLNGFVLRTNLNRFNYIIAASEICQERFSSSFGVPIERVPICGQPRTDILIRGCDSDSGEDGCNILPEKFILYVPTWRESGKNPLDYFDLNIWDKTLSEIDYKLVVKLHPLTRSIENKIIQENISILNDSNIEFTHLLYHTDILITDYSSAMFDFAIMERPILLYTPDSDEYNKKRGLYEPINNLGQEIIFSEEDTLLFAVKESVVKPAKYRHYAKLISERYNRFSDGKNCKRVVEKMLVI